MLVKKIFIDLETTGFDPEENAVVEIAGIIEYGKTYEEFNFACAPFEGAVITKESLEKTGYELDDLYSLPTPEETYKKLISVLSKHIDRYDKFDKFVVFGYGAEFDVSFLRAFFDRMEDKYFGSWFWYPWVDIMSLAMYYLAEKRSKIENFKLVTVAEFVGVPVNRDKLHSALYDIQITKKFYDKIKSRTILKDSKTPEIIKQERIKRKSRYCV